VKDDVAARALYESLGFSNRESNGARDDVTILMALCENPERIVPNWRIVPNVWNVFIRVDDVEAIYAEVQRRGAPLDYSLYDAPSGFREFGVQDPDGHDIAIAQQSPPRSPLRSSPGSSTSSGACSPRTYSLRRCQDTLTTASRQATLTA
jgi:hypothetical protein